MKKDLLSLADFSEKEILSFVKLGQIVKKNPLKFKTAFKNETLLMIFEKPSLRTRVSFEVGMTQMGGHAIYYDVATSPLGKKETIEDTARAASRYVDIIMARLNHFEDTLALSKNSSVPVIDALSDMNHPCQILGDLLTILEHKKKLKGLTLAYFGDAENNVTYSLLHGCAQTGINMNIACPKDKEFLPNQSVLDEANKIAKKTGSKINIYHDAKSAAKDVDVIYTDSWMSYHIDKNKEKERVEKLMPFQVNEKVLGYAKKDVIFMNCLPAKRGYEQTAEVIDGKHSIVFDQAENRLHIQKATMLILLGKR